MSDLVFGLVVGACIGYGLRALFLISDGSPPSGESVELA